MEPSKAITDFYRCPENLVPIAAARNCDSEVGYFKFSDITCYGRSLPGFTSSRPDSLLRDVIDSVAADNGQLLLPFNPTELVENLRLERFVEKARQSPFQRLARRTYYHFRPMLGIPSRTRIQKAWLHGWKNLPFPAWPVDRTVERIFEKIMLLSLEAQSRESVPFIWFWPRGAVGCVVMTHDVESKNGLEACSWLMDIDDSFQIKASFELVPEGRYEIPQELVSLIRSRGFEMAIQDLNHDGLLFLNHDTFLDRAEKINRYAAKYGANGFRAAVLYREATWYKALNFSYDMSIPAVAHLGPQRGGCCTVMPYFIGDMVELPVTTAEDYAVLHLLSEYSINLWKKQTEQILAGNGLVSFIVHPDYIQSPRALPIYEALLQYLSALRKQQNLWFALPDDVNRWWRTRHKLRIVRDGLDWRIEGDGADQAVLAYAKVKGKRLEYEVVPCCADQGRPDPRRLS